MPKLWKKKEGEKLLQVLRNITKCNYALLGWILDQKEKNAIKDNSKSEYYLWIRQFYINIKFRDFNNYTSIV